MDCGRTADGPGWQRQEPTVDGQSALAIAGSTLDEGKKPPWTPRTDLGLGAQTEILIATKVVVCKTRYYIRQTGALSYRIES